MDGVELAALYTLQDCLARYGDRLVFAMLGRAFDRRSTAMVYRIEDSGTLVTRSRILKDLVQENCLAPA